MYKMENYQLNSVLIEQIIDYLPSAIIVLDTDTRIILANRNAELLSNKPRSDMYNLRGGEAFSCIHAQDTAGGCGTSAFCGDCMVNKLVSETIRTKQGIHNVEAPLRIMDVGERIFALSTTWLDENRCIVVSLNDVTDKKNQESTQLKITKLHAAMKTGAAICHEMNQPLSIINGAVELLQMDGGGASTSRDYLGTIRDQVNRLALITRKLMHLTRYEETDYISDKILDINKSSDSMSE